MAIKIIDARINTISCYIYTIFTYCPDIAWDKITDSCHVYLITPHGLNKNKYEIYNYGIFMELETFNTLEEAEKRIEWYLNLER